MGVFPYLLLDCKPFEDWERYIFVYLAINMVLDLVLIFRKRLWIATVP